MMLSADVRVKPVNAEYDPHQPAGQLSALTNHTSISTVLVIWPTVMQNSPLLT